MRGAIGRMMSMWKTMLRTLTTRITIIISNNSDKANADTFLFAILDKLEALNFEATIHIELETREVQERKGIIAQRTTKVRGTMFEL